MSIETRAAERSATGSDSHAPGNYIVACEYVLDVEVSTVRLAVVDGVDSFETMVFTASYGATRAVSEHTRRYSTEAEALAGHVEVVEEVSGQ